MKKSITRKSVIFGLAAALFLELPAASIMTIGFTSDALARIGRPATPGSVAGVARRTTRRTIRRGAYYASLPRGCARTTVYGYAVWDCGGRYYQASGGGYVVVYF